ncbi:DUF3828 domain-containing protein [Rudanella paleaurantiibacter]|uniref:DUF3828 domain-containing protein n=1 Tax=Rudanella paleaurantiibacter TaxID=2614655 RepID=A0A7J5U3J4_9BACT|nr:DUF3828 domain-containing protein [Rudanella paleaurantiibacter]KAB7732414.1 DUF3828 domain-containing protein [Rudanella paleaurantiibacter]
MVNPFTHLVLVGSMALLGCTTHQAQQEASAQTRPAPQTAVAVHQTALTATTSENTPDALIRALYQTHKAGKSPFFQNKDRALIDRFFVKEMADLIWDDAVLSAQTGDVGLLSADPLYNAQDMDIKNFVIHQPEVDGDGAEVLVTFTNFGEKQELTYLLEKENGQWRIGDLFYGDGSQLFQMLSGRAEETP